MSVNSRERQRTGALSQAGECELSSRLGRPPLPTAETTRPTNQFPLSTFESSALRTVDESDVKKLSPVYDCTLYPEVM